MMLGANAAISQTTGAIAEKNKLTTKELKASKKVSALIDNHPDQRVSKTLKFWIMQQKVFQSYTPAKGTTPVDMSVAPNNYKIVSYQGQDALMPIELRVTTTTLNRKEVPVLWINPDFILDENVPKKIKYSRLLKAYQSIEHYFRPK
jgi:hypothetical protein